MEFEVRVIEEHRAGIPIVIFSNGWVMGGMEQHILLLAAELRKRGRRVAVICSRTAGIRAFREALAGAGVAVHALPERSRSGFAPFLRLLDLVRVIRLYSGSLLHMHFTGHHGGDLVILAAKLARSRAIVRTEHNPPVPPISWLDRAHVWLRGRFLNRVICVAQQSLEEHLQRLGRSADKCVVVQNGLDFERFAPLPASDGVHRELGFPPSVPLVGVVSRLSEERKGIQDFIQMAAQVNAQAPDARFVIVGDGELREFLERQAADLGLGGRIAFTGDRRDTPRLLAAMSVFVMPSRYESGPYTLLEAMAAGRPVVTTPVGVAPELIVDGQNGRLASIGDASALADAVLSLLRSPAAASLMGEAGRTAVVNRFSSRTMVDDVERVYEDAIGLTRLRPAAI